MNIENAIRDELIDLLEAEDYIDDNIIPVRTWQTLEEAEGVQVIVHVASVVPSIMNHLGRAIEYETQVQLGCYYHSATSETPTGETETVYQFLLGFVSELAISDITISGLTINGIVSREKAEGYDERFRSRAVGLSLFVQP